MQSSIPQLFLGLLAAGAVLAACGDNIKPMATPDGGMEPDAGTDEPPRAQAGGSPDAVAVVGDRAFIGVGPRLAVWNLAAGGGPTFVGESAPLRGTIDAVAIVGTRAYVGERIDLDSRLHVLDVSNPADIRHVTDLSLVTSGFSVIRDIVASGSTLYVADQEQGVVELSLANPDAPTKVRVAGNPGVANIDIVGDRLYYWAQGFGGTSVGALDLDANLAPLGEGNFFGLHGVAIAAGNLIVGAGFDGIFVYDATDPANPVERFHYGELEGGPFARAVAAHGTAAWVPAEDGLHELDLSTPTAITRTGPIDVPTVGVNAAASSTSHVAAVTDRGRLIAFAVGAASAATATDITLCTDCVGLAASGDTLYAADIARGLRTADVDALTIRGTSPEVPPQPDGLSVVFEDVAIAGNRAYVADWLFGLRIYDVTNPAQITELGELDTPGSPSTVFVSGQRAYLGEGTNGGALRVIDIANPALPSEVGFIETAKTLEVEVVGNIAYVADEELFGPGGLKIYDVSNPASIVLRGTYDDDCGNARDVVVQGTIAIVACSADGFHLVDVTNPAAPARVAVVPPPGNAAAWSVGSWEGHAVLGHDRGVTVVTVSATATPSTIAEHATAEAVRAIAVPEPGRIIAAAGLAGIYQWVPEPTTTE